MWHALAQVILFTETIAIVWVPVLKMFLNINLGNLSVKEFRKSVYIRRSYYQKLGGLFFFNTVYM